MDPNETPKMAMVHKCPMGPFAYHVWAGGECQQCGVRFRSVCAHGGNNHSEDTVNVFHGYATPTTLCGFHASMGHFEQYVPKGE